MSFTTTKKNGLLDFPEKWDPTKMKHSLSVCWILRNLIGGNARKFTVSLAFSTQNDVIKYKKNSDIFLWASADNLSFHHQRVYREPPQGVVFVQVFYSS